MSLCSTVHPFPPRSPHSTWNFCQGHPQIVSAHLQGQPKSCLLSTLFLLRDMNRVAVPHPASIYKEQKALRASPSQKRQLKASQQTSVPPTWLLLCPALIWLVWEHLQHCSHNSDYTKCSLGEGSQEWSSKRNLLAGFHITMSVPEAAFTVCEAGCSRL